MPKQILLVDDDAALRHSLALCLEQAGYRVQAATSAEEALAYARRELPDLALLEATLPGRGGLAALRELRRLGSIPIIFLSARRSHEDEISALAAGADDYIAKPFNPGVLLERIKVILRLYARPAVERLIVGDLTVDPGARTVIVAGRTIDLAPRVFDLLYALAERPGHVIAASELLSRVWGTEFEGQPQVLYVHVRWLREKLESDPSRPQRVISLRRAGYKLVPQEP